MVMPAAPVADLVVGEAQFVVARDPLMRQRFAMPSQQFQDQLVPRAKLRSLRHARLFHPRRVVRPFLGKIQTHVDERVLVSRHRSQEHGDLTVVGLPQPTTPLPRDTDRLAPRLGEPRRIEHENPVRLTQLATDLPRELITQHAVPARTQTVP